MRHTPDGATRELTPAPFNVRNRVHEYGGGSYRADAGARRSRPPSPTAGSG